MSDQKNVRYQEGVKTRRSVLGDAHVNRSDKNKTEFDAPFQELITETAWGNVWNNQNIPTRERSMITIAILAALGQEHELALHLRATANTGASKEDIREALMHVAVYAGVPAANTAFRIAKQTFDEMENGDA